MRVERNLMLAKNLVRPQLLRASHRFNGDCLWWLQRELASTLTLTFTLTLTLTLTSAADIFSGTWVDGVKSGEGSYQVFACCMRGRKPAEEISCLLRQ